MKQTDRYHFHLIEGTDRFSPDTVNENTQMLETQLAALNDALSGCGNARLAWGTYAGDDEYGAGASNTLSFDFVPRLVVVTSGGQTMVAVHGSSRATVFSGSKMVSNYEDSFYNWMVNTAWAGNTLSWWTDDANSQLNNVQTYYYVALG